MVRQWAAVRVCLTAAWAPEAGELCRAEPIRRDLAAARLAGARLSHERCRAVSAHINLPARGTVPWLGRQTGMRALGREAARFRVRPNQVERISMKGCLQLSMKSEVWQDAAAAASERPLLPCNRDSGWVANAGPMAISSSTPN